MRFANESVLRASIAVLSDRSSRCICKPSFSQTRKSAYDEIKYIKLERVCAIAHKKK